MTILGFIQLSSEAIALLSAAVHWKTLKHRGWLLWLPFLLYTCFVEIWAAYIAHYQNENNLWLYNPYIIISIAFYGWFLIQICTLDLKLKKLLYLSVAIYSLACAVWYVAWGNPMVLISVVLNIGALFICLLCLLFFYTQIQHPQHYRSLTKVPGFWITVGLLVFYAGISLYIAIYDFLAKTQLTILGTTIQNLIPQVLSLILYSTIIVSFLRCSFHPKKY